jgi:hypothetical protein
VAAERWSRKRRYWVVVSARRMELRGVH